MILLILVNSMEPLNQIGHSKVLKIKDVSVKSDLFNLGSLTANCVIIVQFSTWNQIMHLVLT